MTRHCVIRLQADSSHAAKILREIADDTHAPASPRVTATRAIIEQAFKGAEVSDLTERIDALGAAQKGKP